MKIEIKVRGNPGLYRSLQESFAAESTTHRTFTGAARRLVRLHGHAKDWSRTTGRWGGWDIFVDGVNLHRDPEMGYYGYRWEEPSPADARERYRDPVDYIAAALAERHKDLSQ